MIFLVKFVWFVVDKLSNTKIIHTISDLFD